MKHVLAVLALCTGLAGCATRWVVDSDVRSFSSLGAVPAGATYRFERLPSQQAGEAQQQQLEAMAGAALERVGLRRDDASPQYTAQIAARVTAELSPWADPWYYHGAWGPGYYRMRPWGYGAGGWYGRGWHGGGWYGSAFPPANPWYAREVSIVLRELPSNRVVYETHARNDGPYTASGAVLPVMFQAALQGFPNPPVGERRVDIEIPTAKN
ncbi:hypothetical protein C7T35_05405 [Variovorax sp. WS11]|uniref:DUF4136 domain-containing protein n=1 Tax=Variovorax sp. WS11 TaxID=1105204 RepID=UPI000D0D2322|nr:DUF4136 domain-containing protein [Variovorax sp. WS11]NDZ14760.1 DUF4136 domain-containing protein [Variovorax sp. WS11]PSL85717.1 hypothetical protein C7T35_05405 [Variovorax sp. WS11]